MGRARSPVMSRPSSSYVSPNVRVRSYCSTARNPTVYGPNGRVNTSDDCARTRVPLVQMTRAPRVNIRLIRIDCMGALEWVRMRLLSKMEAPKNCRANNRRRTGPIINQMGCRKHCATSTQRDSIAQEKNEATERTVDTDHHGILLRVLLAPASSEILIVNEG